MSGLDLKLLFKDAAETTRKEQAVLSVSSAGRERCVCALSVFRVSSLAGCIQTSLNMRKKKKKLERLVWEAAATQQRNGTSASSPVSSGSRLNGQKLAAIPVPKRWSITRPLHRRGCQHFMAVAPSSTLSCQTFPIGVFAIKGCRIAQIYKFNSFDTGAFWCTSFTSLCKMIKKPKNCVWVRTPWGLPRASGCPCLDSCCPRYKIIHAQSLCLQTTNFCRFTTWEKKSSLVS